MEITLSKFALLMCSQPSGGTSFIDVFGMVIAGLLLLAAALPIGFVLAGVILDIIEKLRR